MNRLAKEKTAAVVGIRQKVLCEGASKNNPSTLMGRTPQNKIVIFEGDIEKLTGQIVEVDVMDATDFTAYGEVV
ncbi:MAG: TRAM domain-containing protein [Luteolibacter sp.]